MENDLVGEHPPLGPGDLSVAATLGDFRVNRMESRLWAVTSMKFLIFDDTDIKENGYDSDDSYDEDKMTRLALEMSMRPEDDPGNNSTASSSKGKGVAMPDVPQSYDGNKPSRDEPDKDVEEEMVRVAIERSLRPEDDSGQSSTATSSKGKEVAIAYVSQPHKGKISSEDEEKPCLVCTPIPEFPHNRKTRKFRLFSPKNEFPKLYNSENGDPKLPSADAVCTHYVAMSYCWPPPKMDADGNMVETPRTYKVRDLDGTVRSNRALDDVLDRAVDVANSVGLKMIWIDQECLPQPSENSPEEDKRDHQLGIQAMDLVYDRAMVTAGLMDLRLSSQAQVYALQVFMSEDEARWAKQLSWALEQRLRLIIDFLDRLSQDRWYTRAWVVQEAISSGERLAMVFHRGLGVAYPSQLRKTGRDTRGGSPAHSLDTTARPLPSEVIIITIREFWRLVRRAQTLLQESSFQRIGDMLWRPGSRPAEEIVANAGTLHPVLFRPQHLVYQMGIRTSYIFGNRTVVDAAGALTLLRTRKCRYDEDRVTIMANMCGYEYRLDTKVVAAHCNSLRVALLTLAVLNGDLSPLAPEMYHSPDSTPHGVGSTNGQSGGGLAGWVHPLDTKPGSIKGMTVRGFNTPGVFRPGKIEPSGLSFPAYIWNVGAEDMVDLMPMKVKWLEDWDSLNCLGFAVDRREKETDEELGDRRKAVMVHFAQRHIKFLARLKLMERGFSGDDDDADDSPVWRGLRDRRGVRVERVLVADRLEQVPEMQACFCNIFFGILRFLMDQAAGDPRAQGLADSIWQSVRVDQVNKEDPDLPDNVTEALFSHPAVVTTPFRTLALDRDSKGSYYQAWLLERVMRQGCLWVGRYVPAPLVGFREGTETFLSFLKDAEASSSSSSRGGKRHLSSAASGSSTKKKKEMSRSILARQLRERLLAEMLRMATFERYAKETPENREDSYGENPWPEEATGVFVSFSVLAFNKAAEDDGIRKRISVFDVDGPCTVATPYVTGWEILPHPRPRSMSVCWVVQRVGDKGGSEKQSLKRKRRLSDGSDAAGEDQMAQEEMKYKVLGKVHGMWEVMEAPWQLYLFQ